MNERSRVTGTRICVWLRAGVLALAGAAVAASSVGARAQSQLPYPNPPGGAPPSAPASAPPNAPPASSVNGVYQDAASSACDSKGGFSLNVGGFSPALCKAETMETTGTGTGSSTTNKCFPEGGVDTFLVGQQGNTCYYCLPVNFPANLNVIVVPMDAGQSAYKQGFTCAVAESDGCYMTCDGYGPFNPPAGVTLAPPVNFGGTGQTQKLKLYVTNTPDPCYPAGPKNYNACDYPNLARPAGCVCSTTPAPAKASMTLTPTQNLTPSEADFNNRLLADAQTLLQNAGRISKAMTDAMNPATHNNVGINVALMSAFGALGKTMALVAQQYKLAAAANAAATAAEQAAALEIAGEAAAESATLASEAEQVAGEAAQAGAAPAGGPVGTPGGAPVNAPMGTAGGTAGAGYMEDALLTAKATLPPQGVLPICGVLSCARLAEILQVNAPWLKAFGAVDSGPMGSTPAQMIAGLQKMGITAQLGSGTSSAMTNMMNQVRAGTPVIAGVYLWGSKTPLLHAVVVEGIEEQAGVMGLKIYDPQGWFYWQPIKTFEKFFTEVFVHS